MKATKRTFYPDPIVEECLKKTPPKKLSYRVNQLIIKGILKEEREAIANDYQRYDVELALVSSKKQASPKPFVYLSSRLFENEDEPDDWY